MNISDSLKSFMEIKKLEGISASNIAKKLNISKKTLSNYVNGDAYIPLKHLNKLSNIFDVSVDYILGLTKVVQYPNNKEIDTLIAKDIGNNLLNFRKELKINQEEFSNIINSNKASVSRYENGINLILTIHLYTICKTYKISADYLLGKVDEPKYLK